MAGPWNDKVEQGQDEFREFWFDEPSGAPVSLVGWTFEAELRKGRSPAVPAAATFTSALIPHPTSGAADQGVRISLSDDLTAALAPGDYEFECWSVSPSGLRVLSFAGQWTVNARGGR